jgi:hypothetical protein
MILSVDESLKTEMRNLAMMFHVVSHSIFQSPDIDLMVDDLCKSLVAHSEAGDDVCTLDDVDYKTEYLNTREKIQCAFVAFFLDSAENRYRLADFPFVIKLLCDPPNKVWTTDITYVPTLEGWLYVAVVIDLFSRQVVGWAINDHMRTGLCVDALQMAFWRRKPSPGLLHIILTGVLSMPAKNTVNIWLSWA